jgi:serine protease inhibitor
MEQKTIGILALVSAILLCIIVLAGCIGTQGTTGTPTVLPTIQTTAGVTTTGTPAGPVSDSEKSVAEANNRFALDLYSNLKKDPKYSGNNLFFSPFSISSALAITYEGARGTTADEIRNVFYFPTDDSVRRQGFSEINAGMNAETTGYTLRTANALWAEKTYPFLPGYTSTAERYYSAKTTNLDFIGNPEDSRITINQWVEDKTENKIPNLVPAGAIDSLTRLVITNAIYFKGTWVKQFDKNITREEDFRTAPGKTVRVQMMQRTDKDAVYSYAATNSLQLLEMPYARTSGKVLSMLVILPKEDNLTVAEDSLSSQKLSDIRRSLTSQRVMVFFPKFKLETKYRLPATLGAMGMPTAFSNAADFSGMDGTRNLSISDVIHRAFVDVNEEGTEAAAATFVGLAPGAAMNHPTPPPIPVFRADHPFIFLIQDTETGNILFIGRVVNPAGP